MSEDSHAFAVVQVPPPPCGAESFTITELALAFNVTPRAIRFYEDQGLIAPSGMARTASIRGGIAPGWRGSCAPRMSVFRSLKFAR
jgi:hypothetical protein